MQGCLPTPGGGGIGSPSLKGPKLGSRPGTARSWASKSSEPLSILPRFWLEIVEGGKTEDELCCDGIGGE